MLRSDVKREIICSFMAENYFLFSAAGVEYIEGELKRYEGVIEEKQKEAEELREMLSWIFIIVVLWGGVCGAAWWWFFT